MVQLPPIVEESSTQWITLARTPQVKINGFRVELGEIESYLGSDEGVRASACRVVDGKLVAFVVLANAGISTEDEMAILNRLKRVCASQLPSYMVPRRMHAIAELPLSANGKVDRSRLAASTQVPRQPDAVAACHSGVQDTQRVTPLPSLELVVKLVQEAAKNDLLDADTPLHELDSLELLELRYQLEQALGLDAGALPAALVLEQSSARSLVPPRCCRERTSV
jgi:hypothetical protein